MKDAKIRGGMGWFLVLCLMFMVGCRSTEKTPRPFAFVIIKGNTPGQIRDAATEVFHANGYSASASSQGNLLFEKKGGAMRNFAYGSWLGDDPVWIRVKTAILPTGEMTCRLECSAFMVRDKGGATEEEQPISRLHQGSYQKLLNEIAARLTRN